MAASHCSSWRRIAIISPRSQRPIASFATGNASLESSKRTIQEVRCRHYLTTKSSFEAANNYCSMRRTFASSSTSIDPRKDALTSSDGVVGFPIDFDTASSVEGKESQVREIEGCVPIYPKEISLPSMNIYHNLTFQKYLYNTQSTMNSRLLPSV